MRRVILCALLVSGPLMAAPRTYELPAETAALEDGPDHDLAAGNCAACHSAEYISTQPRGLKDPKAFWTAEVVKMQKAYGAPIEDADVPAIVAYLVSTYGK